MQLKDQESTLQYIHISIPEILLGHIKSKNSWQNYDQEWSYRLDPPHASHPFQRDLYIIKSKNIEQEDIKLLLDNIINKNNKETQNIEGAKKIIKEIISEPSKLISNNFSTQIEELLLDREKEYHYLVCKNYKIIYSVDKENKQIQIADVFDTRQNPVKLKRTK